MSHTVKNNDGLDLFCVSSPPDLVPDGYGPDVVTVSYALTTPSNSGVGAALVTERVRGATPLVRITVIDRDSTPPNDGQ